MTQNDPERAVIMTTDVMCASMFQRCGESVDCMQGHLWERAWDRIAIRVHVRTAQGRTAQGRERRRDP